MDIPPRLEIELSTSEPSPASDLIVGMQIRACTKNPYRIYFPKTDASGRTALDSTDIVGQFKDHWEEGLMDFNGTLESASQTAVFFLFDTRELQANLDSALAWPLLTHERTIWQSRTQKIDYFLSCSNSRYRLSETEIAVPANGSLRLQVHRR